METPSVEESHIDSLSPLNRGLNTYLKVGVLVAGLVGLKYGYDHGAFDGLLNLVPHAAFDPRIVNK